MEGRGYFTGIIDMFAMAIKDEELTSSRAKCTSTIEAVPCRSEATDKVSGPPTTTDNLETETEMEMEMELPLGPHQRQLGARVVAKGGENLSAMVDMFVKAIVQEELNGLSVKYDSGNEAASRCSEAKKRLSGKETIADENVENPLLFVSYEHQERLSREFSACSSQKSSYLEDVMGGQRSFSEIVDMIVTEVVEEELNSLSASYRSSFTPLSSCIVKKRLPRTGGHALANEIPFHSREHQRHLGTEHEIMEGQHSFSGMVDMFVSAIVEEELNSLSVNCDSTAEPLLL